jgi:hypothetical protein
MKSILLFFNKLTLGKKILLGLSPLMTTIMNLNQLLFALLILVILDLITGIFKSLKLKNIKVRLFKTSFWMEVNSSGFRATWIKSYQYCIGILAFIVLDAFVLKGRVFNIPIIGEYTIAQLAAINICAIEMWSVFENMEAVSGQNPLKKMLGILPRSVKGMFESKDENKL